MEERSFEIKVGIFILVGIILLFIIIFSIGNVYIFEKVYRIKVVFNYVSGLGESAPVRFAGVGVGNIEDIHIFYDLDEKRTKIKVIAKVKQFVRIEKDSRAVINTLGLLGEKYLEIFPGTNTSEFLKDGDTIIGQDPIAMEDVTSQLTGMIGDMKGIIGRINAGEGTVGKLLVEEEIYCDLRDFVKDIKAHPWKLLHRPKSGE